MTSPLFDVLGIGENSIDYVYRLPSLPQPGVTSGKMRIGGAARRPGGQVATTMSACAALGLRAAYVGAFGTDENSRSVRDALTARGVDLQSAPVRHGAGRYAVILVSEENGDRVVLWDRDPAVTLTSDDVTPEMIARARLLHVDATEEAVAIHAASLAQRAGVPVTCDIDHLAPLTPDLLALVSVVILAEQVAQALTGEPDVEPALRALRRRHAGMLCVTRGERGALLLDGDTLHEAPAVSVAAVDTTGAGDVFRAGFIYALLRGDAPAEILRFANAAAAVSCTRDGAMESVPTLQDVTTVLRSC